MIRYRHTLLAAVLVLGWAGTSFAQVDDEAENDASVQLFDQGVEALRQEDYAAASTAFRASYRARPRVATMCNLALTYDRAGEPDRALAAYRTCARDDTSGTYRDFAEERATAIERELALDDQARVDLPDPVEETPMGQPVEDEPRDEVITPLQPAPRAERPSRAPLVVSIASASLAVAAFIPAVVLALDTQDVVERLRNVEPIVLGSPEHLELQNAQQRGDIARVLYGVAGGMAVVSIVAGIWQVVVDRRARNTEESRIRLVPGFDLVENEVTAAVHVRF